MPVPGGSKGGGAAGGVGKLVYYLMGDARSYMAAFRGAVRMAETASKRIVAMGTRIEKIGRGIQRMGMRLTVGLTLPLLLIGGMAVKSFAKFDQAMIESTSIMRVTETQTARMRETAISLGGQAIQGPAELARSYFYLASAGKDAEQSMALLPKVMAFATAGAFDMALATDLLTDAQSALGMTSKDAIQDAKNMAHLSDLLVGANTLANASVQQFSTALTSKAGTAFKAYNIDLKEGIALLAAYADQGIKAEYAGNVTSRMLLLLTKAARDNAAEFEKMNIRVFDAQGEFRTFQQIIGDMERAFKHMSTEQQGAALSALGFEARVQAAILPLLGTSEAIGEYVRRLGEMDGITKKVAEKQMKSFSNQLKVLKNQLSIVGIEIGKTLAPMLLELVRNLKDGITWWRSLSKETKTLIVHVGLLAATIGPLTLGLGLMIRLVGVAVIGFGKLVGTLFFLKPVLGFIALVFSPTGWLLAGIGLLVYAIGNMTGAWEELGKLLKDVGRWFSEVFGPSAGELKKTMAGIVNALKAGDLAGAWKVAMLGLKSTFYSAVDGMMKKWGTFIKAAAQTFLAVVQAIGNIWLGLQATISRGIIQVQRAWHHVRASTSPEDLPGMKAALAGQMKTSDVADAAVAQYKAARRGYAGAYKAAGSPTREAAPRALREQHAELLRLFEVQKNARVQAEKAFHRVANILAGKQYDTALAEADKMAKTKKKAWEDEVIAMSTSVDKWTSKVVKGSREAAKALADELASQEVLQRTGEYARVFAEEMEKAMGEGVGTGLVNAADMFKEELEKGVTVPLDFQVKDLGFRNIGEIIQMRQWQKQMLSQPVAGTGGGGAVAVPSAAGTFGAGTNRGDVKDIVARLDKVIEIEEEALDMAIELEAVELE